MSSFMTLQLQTVEVNTDRETDRQTDNVFYKYRYNFWVEEMMKYVKTGNIPIDAEMLFIKFRVYTSSHYLMCMPSMTLN